MRFLIEWKNSTFEILCHSVCSNSYYVPVQKEVGTEYSSERHGSGTRKRRHTHDIVIGSDGHFTREIKRGGTQEKYSKMLF